MRRPRLQFTLRGQMVVVGIIALALVPGVPAIYRFLIIPWQTARDESFRLSHHGDFTSVSLDQSPFLQDVVEPIVFTEGDASAGSDNCWLSVTFKDARQTKRTVKYVFYLPGTYKTLVLGKKRVPIGGREECACLGLLQRWYRQDSEARELCDRLDRGDPSLTSSRLDGLPDQFTEQQRGKVVAAHMIRALMRR
jgi:hypothetical protein